MNAGARRSPLLSICIPSYNRPDLLERLLRTIDGDPKALEVVICEDHAPKRAEVRRTVEGFRDAGRFEVVYHENHANLGYDGNLQELIRRANGEFVMFMGDDDEFTPGQLDRFLEFLRGNRDLGYVLRSYQVIHPGGLVEPFRYYPDDCRFPASLDSYVALFRRSVTISGVTFRRDCCLPLLTDRFNGTLLIQCYLAAEITLRFPSAYSTIPISTVNQTYRDDKPNFGAAASERSFFEPGKVTLRNSVNFMKGFLRISRDMDSRHGFDSTPIIRDEMSKYSYPVLSIQRKRGVREFLRYAVMLKDEVGIATTPYFYLYAFALLVCGERFCDTGIIVIKKILGRTPVL